MIDNREWTVLITGSARKQQKMLPIKIGNALKLLLNDLKKYGPETIYWQNFSELTGKKIFITAT